MYSCLMKIDCVGRYKYSKSDEVFLCWNKQDPGQRKSLFCSNNRGISNWIDQQNNSSINIPSIIIILCRPIRLKQWNRRKTQLHTCREFVTIHIWRQIHRVCTRVLPWTLKTYNETYSDKKDLLNRSFLVRSYSQTLHGGFFTRPSTEGNALQYRFPTLQNGTAKVSSSPVHVPTCPVKLMRQSVLTDDITQCSPQRQYKLPAVQYSTVHYTVSSQPQLRTLELIVQGRFGTFSVRTSGIAIGRVAMHGRGLFTCLISNARPDVGGDKNPKNIPGWIYTVQYSITITVGNLILGRVVLEIQYRMNTVLQ